MKLQKLIVVAETDSSNGHTRQVAYQALDVEDAEDQHLQAFPWETIVEVRRPKNCKPLW